MTKPVIDLPAVGPEHAWERQPRESDEAWALFCMYRDSAYPDGIGAGYVVRSLSDMARQGGWDVRQLKMIAESFDWANRAIQFDRYIDTAKTEASVAQLPEVLDEHKKILKDLRRLIQTELGKWLALCETTRDPQVKIRELHKLIDVAVKLDRLTYGESTEIVKLEGEWDLSGASLDQLKALREIAQQAGVEVEETLH